MSEDRPLEDDEWTPEAIAEVNRQMEEVVASLKKILEMAEHLARLSAEHPSPPKSCKP
jgi:hypothetical protein